MTLHESNSSPISMTFTGTVELPCHHEQYVKGAVLAHKSRIHCCCCGTHYTLVLKAAPLYTIYREDGRVEVQCEHAIGHTTPKSARKWAEANPDAPARYGGIHGCDACCVDEGFFPEEHR